MAPEREIEVRAELAVSPHEQVQIEFRGHAGAVVVGGLQNFAVFLKIDADDQAAAVAAEPANAPQEMRATSGSRFPMVEPGK